ncbi:hypothetical protein RJI07_03525 [Mycoplasmatota bacterium WC30]
MALISKIKEQLKKKTPKEKKPNLDLTRVSVDTMESKFEIDDLVGAAKDLKILLEFYGKGKSKNHRYKGRDFIYFILSNKHKDLKNVGYKHWQNFNQIIILKHQKVYPYHRNNLRSAMDFFKKEIKSLSSFDIRLV